MYKIIKSSLVKNLFSQTALSFKNSQSFSWKRNLYINKPGGSQIQNVTLIPGQGIGPEITDSVRKIFEAAMCPIKFDVVDNFDLNNEECKQKLKKNYATLLGVIVPNDKSKLYSENTQYYKFLDVFVQVVSVWSLPPETKISKQIHDDVDIVLCRENTEGEYSGIEHEVYPGVMESLKVTTAAGSERVANYAFEFCYLSGRKKVTAVHKANIMKVCDGLFLDSCRKVAKKFPQIKYEEMIVDNASMQLVKYPQQFDVILTTNLYGTVLSNICAGITGGTGLCAGTLIGKDYAVFGQGCNHTGYKIQGQNIANPTAMIRAGVVMLRHLGLPRFAESIATALKSTLREIDVHTPDMGGKGTTTEFTQSIIKNLKTQ